MRGDGAAATFIRVVSLTIWGAVILSPLAFLFVQVVSAGSEPGTAGRLLPYAFRSLGLAAVIAGAAVVLGWVPGRLLGTSRRNSDLLLLLLLMPLVLPQYVLYYAWSLLLTPTSGLGQYLSSRTDVAKAVGTVTSSSVLILWYWPLAALLLAQGWRSFDKAIRDCAALDANGFEMFRSVTLPLLGRPLILAFGACFVLALSEFATFHLAGIQTIGAELAVLYELTGSEGYVVRAAWPVVIVAVVVAFGLGRSSGGWASPDPALDTVEFKSQRWRWGILLGLMGISVVGPLFVLVANISGSQAFRQFFKLHLDELGWSLWISVVAAAVAYLIALGGVSLGSTAQVRRPGSIRHRLWTWREFMSLVVRTTIFLAMFVPASVVAVSLLKLSGMSRMSAGMRQSWYMVSAGQAARFAGAALVLLLLTREAQERRLSEMAWLDGASRFQAWWHVQLPRTWPLLVGTFILVVMLSITELAATMVLLPTGLPNFAQRLLNQMHYARDQQVIASCLVLICLFVALSGVVVLLLRAVRVRRGATLLFLCAMAVGAGGCDARSGGGEAKVVDVFGQGGRGPGQFAYPRAIDIAADNTLLVVDKTGRIQRLDAKGKFLGVMNMPQIEKGKPTGLSIHPNGNIYVADTHYHRVVVFSPEGEIINEFGKFGQDEGCFIYPTDVTFSNDGKVYVSEYGGNDRISVFTEQGGFVFSFGSQGSGRGQFSRPSALCIDHSRERLYVADACNHRIAVYTPDGELLEYIGSAGRDVGQLRYPYDLALLSDGTLAICEFGNNRIQLFSPEGRSLAVYGRAGRGPGELAYPWGVAVDRRDRAFIVDAGNNRIQVWQL